MTRNRILLATAVAGLGLCLAGAPAQALTLSGSFTNGTSDNDDDGLEDAGRGGEWLTSTSENIADVVGSSATVERRFTGQSSAVNGGDITQSVDVTVTWSVTADPNVVYDITFSPDFGGLLRVVDASNDEAGDQARFGTLSAVLKVNGGNVADTLALGPLATQTVDGSQNVNRSATQTLTGLSGSNTFELTYTGTFRSQAASGLLANMTSVAALWGLDGTLDGGYGADDTFDEYASAAARDNDGLFMPATVTITAVVPEPGTALLLASGLAGLAAVGRRRA